MALDPSLIEKFSTMDLGHIEVNQDTLKACSKRFRDELKVIGQDPAKIRSKFVDLCPDNKNQKCHFWMQAYRRESVYEMRFVRNLEVMQNTSHVTPKLIRHFWCDGYGILVREMWSGDLIKLALNHPEVDFHGVLFDVLHRLHQQGWAHRRLKPENIVYRTNEEKQWEFAFIGFDEAISRVDADRVTVVPHLWDREVTRDLQDMVTLLEEMNHVRVAAARKSTQNVVLSRSVHSRVTKFLARSQKKTEKRKPK